MKMNMTKTMLALTGAALMALGAVADPTITISRIQQRYPWNGYVDIDYTVAGVPEGQEGDYYVQFTVSNDVTKTSFVLDNFADDSRLAFASNGTWRATWRSGAMPVERFLARNVEFKAAVMFDPGCNGARTPYRMIKYLVIDLTEGPEATSYPISTEYYENTGASQELANVKYNADEYKTNKLVLRRILRGTFTMGSPTTETGRQLVNWMNKETQHEVTLTKDYYIGVFPVTQTQWLKVMGGTNPSSYKGNTDAATCPVEMVSYQMIRGATKGIAVPITGEVDAGSFLKLLRDKTGLTDLDLPTEAQWEYATRAGTTDSTYFGNNVTADATLLKAHIWYNGNSASKTHGVGQFPSNPWGLYDTLGNVWEWCRDRVTVAPSHDLGSAAATDPLSEVSNGNGTLRGGDWYNDATSSRSACRAGDTAVSGTTVNCGFRLSRPLP